MSIVVDVHTPALSPADADRAAIIDAQVDMLALLERHCLGLEADIAILSAAIAYLSHAHGIDPHDIAFRAASPAPRGERGLH